MNSQVARDGPGKDSKIALNPKKMVVIDQPRWVNYYLTGAVSALDRWICVSG
jgi:hypothetical protein